MKKITSLALALAAISAPALKASTFSFNVNLNVASLETAGNNPFFLDVALNPNSTAFSNTVTLSNFAFTGGSATGSAVTVFAGNGSGSFTGTASLNDAANTYSEIYQGFSTSTSAISFTVTTTQNGGTPFPDELVLSILDSESGNPQIATNAPDTVGLVELGIAGSNQLSDIGTYSSTSPSGVLSSVSAVPEPSTYGLIGAGALVAVSAIRRKRRAA